MTAVARPADLSLTDRHLTGAYCDRCGASSKVATQHARGAVLTWCAHHFRALIVAMLAQGAIVLVDGRSDEEKRNPGSRS